MVYMVSLSTSVRRVLNIMSNQENRFIAFERCNSFANIPPEEGYKYLPEMKRYYKQIVNREITAKNMNFVPPEDLAGWPRTGTVELRNFSVKYRVDLDYVLRNISFKLESGEKLGILGRTGAGKSSLISSMYRYFSNFEGDVMIDGTSIKSVDIQKLRSSLTIIPQDPILFNATIRKNIDPSDRHTAAEIETVLKEIGLWEKFEAHSGINFMVEAGGSNLSQGEKQLICFGRALLEKNKVILMDEASANIDAMTEETMQRLMKEKFKHSTIMMIAHKLNTIKICDK
jgi:ABC-type multidrug transport system fused ATPase/permease subunit